MKMIRGGRALAAALGGATAFVKDKKGVWRTASVRVWRQLHDMNSPLARVFGVRADDARRVLG